MAELIVPTKSWQGVNGVPLNNGRIYIGIVDLEPVANPKPIFSDRELTVSLGISGVALDSYGNPTSKIWLEGRYSIKVEDSAGAQVFLELDNGEEPGVTTTALTGVLGSNAITADASPAITSLADNSSFIFEVVTENDADVVTLAIGTTGAKAIKRNFDQDVGKGKFKVGQKVEVVYNEGNDNYEWMNENARVLYETVGADIASAATVDLALATGNKITITGNTGPITSFGTVLAGVEFTLTFASTPTIIHNDTSLILPLSGDDMVAEVGDSITLHSLGAGNWKVTNITRANNTSSYPKDYISGFDLITNSTDPTNDIDISPGVCRDQDNTTDIELTSTLVKQIDAAYAEGTNQGGYDSVSALANDTWYHIHVVKNVPTGVVDVCFDASVTADEFHTNNANHVSRRIGSVRRDTATNRQFASSGGNVFYGAREAVVNGSLTTGGATLTLVTPPDVVCLAHLTFSGRRTLVGTSYGLLNPLNANLILPTSSQHNLNIECDAGAASQNTNDVVVATNTSSQIRERVDTNTSTNWVIQLTGYFDFRGV